MNWLVWIMSFFAMEFGGGQTMSHWAADLPAPEFIGLIGILIGVAVHFVRLRFDCFGAPSC